LKANAWFENFDWVKNTLNFEYKEIIKNLILLG
jgi:hypothetical protein